MSAREVGNKDKGQLLGIFSAEVWLLILENVKNGADFQRIGSSSPYFRTLLQPRATQTLFPEVLQILIQQQPPLFTSGAELLPLRQVCQAWKSAVEQVLDDPEYPFMSEREQWEQRHLMKDNPTYVNNDDAKIKNYETLETLEYFTKFQQHFNPTRAAAHISSPLFCRELVIDFPMDVQDLEPYFQAFLQFLQTYGTHVWYCGILHDFGEHRHFWSDHFKQLLELMPNLRRLHFTDMNGDSNLFQDFVTETPFPELKQLQMISIEGFPLPFLRALVQKNPQVSMVSDVSVTPKQDYVTVYLEQMPNLTDLEIKMNHADDFEALRRSSVNCPLKTLNLNIKWGKTEKQPLHPMPIGPLFRVLEAQFSATLTELKLKFHSRVNLDEQEPDLQLPRLKKLSVTFRGQLIPLDFMLPLKDTLEQLSVGVRFDNFKIILPPFDIEGAKAADRTVKLYQFWIEPQKSNAWTLFPKLKLLRNIEKDEIYSCTREQWIAKQPLIN